MVTRGTDNAMGGWDAGLKMTDGDAGALGCSALGELQAPGARDRPAPAFGSFGLLMDDCS